MRPTPLHVAALLAALGPTAFAQTSLPPQQARAAFSKLAPFEVLDNVEGAFVDLVMTTIRPLAFHPSSGQLYAVNSHASTLVEFDAAGNQVRSLALPWGPVAVAYWQAADEGPEALLVVCRGTHTLARVELPSGTITSLFELESEPADIVVHPGSNHAFVSCSGSDSVLEIDVAANVLVRRYGVPSKRPTFLTLEGADVLVAPMLSGNNSIAETGPNILDAGDGRVLDLEDPAVAQKGLNDHDLFRITPGTNPVLPIARDMGTVLFAVGVNPVTGDIWQLGTEANNKDATRMGEPAIRGEIAFNQVALALPQSGLGGAIEPFAVINLDDTDVVTPGIQYDSTRSVGGPYALAFDAAGQAYITGLLTNNVVQYTAAGAFVREWNVGSIPRAVQVSANGERAWVYLWGTNTIELYDLLPATPALLTTLDLGHDPTPPERQAGRELFFSAAFSMHNNAACGTCHVETESDLLPWDLSNLPFDDKGPLVTQTMRGIGNLEPLHWRGERAHLIDFNGAFDGLLGGPVLDEAPGGQFDQFRAYVFSLEQPANPNEHARRMVDSRRGFTTPDGTRHRANAVRGQDAFINEGAVPLIGSCNACHALPTGTNHEVVLDEPFLEAHPRRTHFKIAPFNGLWRKNQTTLEEVIFASGASELRPTLGSGPSAAGLKDSVLDFVEISLFTLDGQVEKDITAFVEQLDSGIAPAVHKSYLVSAANPAAGSRVVSYLLDQARKRNCDIAVFGHVDLGQGPRQLRWFFERTSGAFVSEDASVAPRSAQFFVAQAQQGLGSNVVLGLPVGMAERFAVDFDADALYNADELALGSDPLNPDSDGDGDPDGHEVQNGSDPLDDQSTATDTTAASIDNVRVIYTTTLGAKLAFDTNEATRFDLDWTMNNFSGAVHSDQFETNHTVILPDLRPNALHTVNLDVIDRGGNVTSMAVAGVQTLPRTLSVSVMLRAPSVTVVQDSSGTLHLSISGRARRKGGGFLSGHQLRVQVFVNGVLTQPMVFGTSSGGDGTTTVDVIENGLAIDDEVRVTVFTVFDLNNNTGATWSMPDTLPAGREFIESYTGTGP